MLQDVVHSLPPLLAQKLEEVLPKGENCEFAAPIRIRIPVRLSDLTTKASPAQDGSPAQSRATPSLERKLDSALRQFFSPTAREAEPVQELRLAIPNQDADEKSIDDQSNGSGAIARVLMKWQRAGFLEARLAALANEEIAGWNRVVCDRATELAESTFEGASSIEEQVLHLAKVHENFFSRKDCGNRMRLRLMVAAAVAVQLHISLDSPPLLRVLNRVLPVDEESTLSRLPNIPKKTYVGAETKSHEKTAPSKKPSPPLQWEANVDCALPFLLLGPLSKLGYFDALAGVLEAANLSDAAPIFAAALAYKVLDPPERGWRRTPSSVQAATAFAGKQEAVANESLVEFCREFAPHTALLDQILTESLIRGHTPGDPVLLLRADSENSTGFLLIETSGCFPIVWSEGVHRLLQVLDKLGNSIVLVARAAAGPQILKELDHAGFTFVTDVPPTRGETWQRIRQGPAPLGWTNHTDPESIPVLQAGRTLDVASAEATALWETFAVARSGIVHGSLPQLERSLTLAATVATGMIAWQLWRTRGRTNPQIVVERFCDLDGRVRFSPKFVNVLLPLGRRHEELLQGGFLNPTRDIPWFGSRQVELGGG